MNGANEFARLVDELAGHWIEPALDVLKDAGMLHISVETELETWRILKKVLHFELRWQRAFRITTLVSMTAMMEQVLRKATLLVARKFEPESVSHAFQSRLRRAVSDQRSTPSERRLYAELVRQPQLRAAFKPPTRTDFLPRLQIPVSGG